MRTALSIGDVNQLGLETGRREMGRLQAFYNRLARPGSLVTKHR
jgi:hypothetical protein